MIKDNLMDKIVSLSKRRGFIFQNSDIYGGLANTWDYGPYGVELKNNVKQAWWGAVVHRRNDMFGMDAAILMHSRVWEASGHLSSFSDLFVECKDCKKRFKVEGLAGKNNKCPQCGSTLISKPRRFDLMLKTSLGAAEGSSEDVYLRPETAQGMFVNFLNILDSRHPRLPFGIAQIGKAFRNEITAGNFIFRTREFEQMEIEYFIRPENADKFYKQWIQERFNWYINLGIRKENLRKKAHSKEELAHYAKACTDIEYNFPFGWSELEGIANRTDFDLRRHSELSGRKLQFFDDRTKKRFYPYIIEPSGGVDRSALAFLVDAYREEEVKGRKRVFLSLDKRLAPTKVAVLPLLKNRPPLTKLAREIATDLKKNFITVYDDTAAIGKLYRRQDEVGTLYCVTIDVQSLEDREVTVRHRDSMRQDRVGVDQLKQYLREKLVSD